MKINNLIIVSLIFNISGCMTQAPAPIAYHSETVDKSKAKQYSNRTISVIPEEPVYTTSVTPKIDNETVIFQHGDNLIELAKKYSVNPTAILLVNNISNQTELSAGQRLIIPKTTIYTVGENESFAIIVKRYNQNPEIIAKLNGMNLPYVVYPGDTLEVITEPPTNLGFNHQKNIIPNTGSNLNEAVIQPSVINETGRQSELPTTNNLKAKFQLPVQGEVIGSFNKNGGTQQHGIVIAAKLDTPVKAAANGQVSFVGNKPETFGNMIIIKHDDGSLSAYAHLNKILVTKGQIVTPADTIGNVGKSGNATSTGLYYALKINNVAVDPVEYSR